jgi:hypothetical protein
MVNENVVASCRFKQVAIRNLIIALAVLGVLGITAAVLAPALSSHLRNNLVRALEEEYAGQLEVDNLRVSVFPRIRVEGQRVVFRQKARLDAPPLVTIDRASAETDWISALRRQVRLVRLAGMKITIPRRRLAEKTNTQHRRPEFVIDQIDADGTVLTILPKQPGKVPLEFDLYRLTVHGAGPHDWLKFESLLENAKPPGRIETWGTFGPFNVEEPGATPVSGNYRLNHADLSVFKGISGFLSSSGELNGVLDHINVEGTTDTPNFALRVSGHQVHLTTQFKSVVDGTTGNTNLEPVIAEFRNTTVSTRGGVDGHPGVKGKTISLQGEVDRGRVEDILRLAVKSNASMTGAIRFRSRIVIPPGDIDSAERLQLDGSLAIGKARFSNPLVQERVNSLSHRSNGQPQESVDENVATNFQGKFSLRSGVVRFTGLSFEVPGAVILLDGTYNLLDKSLDMHGKARMKATLSQMTTGWKSLLLKVVDPFFKKHGAGAEVPIKIGGTADHPTFALNGI